MTDKKPKFDSKSVRQHYARYRTAMTAVKPGDKAMAEAAIDRLYTSASFSWPAIIWCRSPYELLVLPSLLTGILHSDMWELIAGELTARASSEDWNEYWQEIWPQIWQNSGQPLLEGMNATSRIKAFYADLQPGAVAQAKEEFGRALHSGRLDNMQRSLKREMYRRFWALHDLGQDVAKLKWARLKADVFTKLGYLRSENPSWMPFKLIPFLDEDLNTLGMGIGNLFDFLADRLGGEPRMQAKMIHDMPAALPWMATATLLARAWPEHFSQHQDDLQMWGDIADNCSAVMCLDGVAFLCEKPTAFHLDEQRRLHNAKGPALTFADGFTEYAWRGVLVPGFVIEEPETISVELIESTDNVELRRVMLEFYGFERYIVDAGVKPVQDDECGVLYRREMRGDEALVMVKVINSTAEPDGTFKTYFLRVPPQTTTAREAVAWTFGFDSSSYSPLYET